MNGINLHQGFIVVAVGVSGNKYHLGIASLYFGQGDEGSSPSQSPMPSPSLGMFS